MRNKGFEKIALFGFVGFLIMTLRLLLPIHAFAEEAQSLSVDISHSGGQSLSNVRDTSYDTKMSFAAGDEISISSEAVMQCLYIRWAKNPGEWTVVAGGSEIACGTYGFLHEYVELPAGCKECKLVFKNAETMCDLLIYGEGDLPRTVQKWEPPCEKADFLVFSTHADDEILFLGGVLVEYAGVQDLDVQVVYMTNYWNGLVVREHEKLDGIWESGVKNYPVIGPFDDLYAKDYEAGKTVYNQDEVTKYMTEQVRRFQPLVVVTQDVNGEYGHGGHCILAHAIMEAVDHSMEETFYPESVSTYGTYDVPKTYLHLYSENKIRMDLRQPLDQFGGRTALEVAADAYKKHVSQQWCWFYVSDDYQYSCADFGLYRTTVGVDTGNDMMENLVSYEEQARIEAERLEQERLEEERKQKEEQERLEAEQKQKEAEEQAKVEKKEKTKKGVGRVFLVIGIIVGAVVLLLGGFIAVMYVRKRIEQEKRRKRKMEQLRRRRMQERNSQGSGSRSGQRSSSGSGSGQRKSSGSGSGQRRGSGSSRNSGHGSNHRR